MLFTLYVQVLKMEPPVDLFVRLLTDTVCARPGLRTLYDNVLALKEQGLVHSIFMCTAARDSLGWVSFLKVVLEKWYGRKVYDNVVEGTEFVWLPPARCGSLGRVVFLKSFLLGCVCRNAVVAHQAT